ncbi:uncharacterized protein [Panulirus ornatus]|uniref:uncharacterized protein n=1 Tax=Panulirus ornatus TaxID=150431 RepID=UPI003A88870C
MRSRGPPRLDMSGSATVLLLLLAASSVSARGWAGGRDAINTGRGVEDPEPQPRPLALHPPHSTTPRRDIPLQTDGGTPGNADAHSSYPEMSPDEDKTSRSSRSRSHIPQSSTSLQFFQSSSFYQTNPENSRASESHMTAGRQPYHLSELPSSSPPPLVPMWPDPPPAAPPSSPPAATRAALTALPTSRTSTEANWDHGPLFTGHNRQRKPRLRSDSSDGRKKHLRMSASVRTTWSNRKHQPLGFRGPPVNTRYLKTNIQPDRGKSQLFRRRFKAVRQNRDGCITEETDSINENTDDQPQDRPEILMSSEMKPDRSPELPVGKRNVTGQVLQQFPGHSKEARHEKLTQDFPAQEVEEGESTKTFSEELRETQLGEGEGETERNHSEGTNTASRDVESVAEGNGQEIKPLVTDAADNIKDFGLNDTTLKKPQHVNLDTLEMELSQKDEEAASDLLLAISILQHHLVPDMSEKREGSQTHNTSATSGLRHQPFLDHSTYSDDSKSQEGFHHPSENDKKYNIEIFDALSPGSEEGAEENEEAGEQSRTNLQHTASLQEGLDVKDRGASRYRWFVLVLDGNCSVIKHRMTAFVTFLKAALSSKLSIDYNDVYVPSVFCDNTFMVNISLDTIKNPQVETRLRTLAEANTTLLEISEEIFYLEKILTKRSDEENQNLQPMVKKPDDVELVIYIAVGCMCMFILLSVVIVMLIRVCRQEGDQLDLGKPHPHQIIPRSLDFPIRRPNVIYSHRFSQALTPGKCGRRGLEDGQIGGTSSGVAVVAVGGTGGRGSLLRYDSELVGDLAVNADEVYSIAALTDDPYHDRRALVPARRRVRHTPGEDVILEEDLAEEEEEEEEEERRRRAVDLPEDEVLLEEDMDEDGDPNQVHRPETPRGVSSSGSIVRAAWGPEGVDRSMHGSGSGSQGLFGAGPSDVMVTGNGEILSGIDNPCYNR